MEKEKLTFSVNRNGHFGLDKLLIASVLLQMINGLYCVGYRTFVPSPRFDLSDPTTFVDYRPVLKKSNSGFKSFKPVIGQRYDVFKRSHAGSIPLAPFVVERGSIRVDENGKIIQEKIIMPTIFKRIHTASHYHPEQRPKFSIQTVPLESHFTEGLHAPYYKDDQPFKPIMVPSPVNLEPVKPPTFQTTRSKVQEIRDRNKVVLHTAEPKSESLNDDGGEKSGEGYEITRAKVEEIRSKHQDFLNHKVDENKGVNEIFYAQYDEPKGNTLNDAIPVTEDVDEPPFNAFKPMQTQRSDPPQSQLDKELSYFQSREKELGSDEEISITTTTEPPRPETTQRSRRFRGKPTRSANKDEEKKESKVVKQRIRKKPENDKTPFVPIKRYAQVRHQIKETHLPAADEESEEDAGRLKERITTLKRHTVQSEEGSENINYDHGGEESEGEFNVTEIMVPVGKSDRHRRRRFRRDVEATNDNDNTEDVDDDEDVEVIPMALALVQSKDGPRLSGDELLAYISEVIKNSTIYAPDEDEDPQKPRLLNKSKIGAVFSIPIKKQATETKTSYNYYKAPTDIKRRPVQNLSPYDRTKNQICDEDVDGNESDSEQESYENRGPQVWNHRPRKRLGGRIDCLKNKYFGKNPFSNAFFQEEYVGSPQTQTLQLKLLKDGSTLEKTPQTSNHLVTVYDDIIHNIKHTLSSDEEEEEEAADDDDDDDSSSEESEEVDEHLAFEATKTGQFAPDSVNSGSHRRDKIFNTITDSNIKEFSLLKSSDSLPAYSIFDITQYFPKALANLPLEPDTKTGFRTKTKLNSYRKPTDTPDLEVLKVVPSPVLAPRPPSLQSAASSTKLHSSHYSAQNLNQIRAPTSLQKTPSQQNFRTKPKPMLPPLQRRKRYRYETIIFI